MGPVAGTFHTALGDDAAIAVATVGAIAVVGPNGENIAVAITRDQLRTYVPPHGHKVTNETIKYLRDFVGEKDVRGQPGMRAIEVTTALRGGGLSIPPMTKPMKTGCDEGMDYKFHLEQPPRHVDPWAMIANLPAKQRDDMLRDNHVCRMTLEWVPGAYDRKRRDMAVRCK